MPFVRISVHIRPDEWLQKGDPRADAVEEIVVPDTPDGEWKAFTKAQDAITRAQKKYKEVTGGASTNSKPEG